MHPYRKVRDEQGEYSGVEDSNPPVCAFLYALSLFDALIAHRDFDDYSTFGVATIGRRQQVVDRANEIRANVFIPRRRQPLLQRFEEV